MSLATRSGASSSKMNGRRGKQCRDRWLNHLKPDIRRGEWTAEEERILVEGHRMLGTRWARSPSCSPAARRMPSEPLARDAAVQVGAARRAHLRAPGVPALAAPHERGRWARDCGAEGGGDQLGRREPVPHGGGVRGGGCGGGGGGGDQELGHAGLVSSSTAPRRRLRWRPRRLPSWAGAEIPDRAARRAPSRARWTASSAAARRAAPEPAEKGKAKLEASGREPRSRRCSAAWRTP